jgi:hypothetical protein
MASREKWYIKNISTKKVSLGDLPKVPTLNPGDVKDLLSYYGKTQINLSVNLQTAVSRNYLTLNKILDNVSSEISKSNTPAAVTIAEQNEIGPVSNPVSVENGGTGANLSSSGGSGQYVKQSSLGGNFSVSTINANDIPSGINAAKIGSGNVSNTEFEYLDGVTSSIQDQLDSKTDYVQNIINVNKNPGIDEFSSVKDAVDSILDSSSTNRYLVNVGPGIYSENEITLKSYITVQGTSQLSTIIEASTTNQNIFNMVSQSMIKNLFIRGATDSGKCAIYYAPVSATPTSFCWAENITFGSNNILAKSVGTTGVSANLQLHNVRFGGFDFVTGFWATNDGGGTSTIQLRSISTTNGGITNTLVNLAIADSINCQIVCNSGQLSKGSQTGSGNGFYAINGGILRLTGVNLKSFNKAIYIPNIGVNGPNVSTSGVNFENNNLDVDIQHISASGVIESVSAYLKADILKSCSVYIVNNDPQLITVAEKGGDFSSVAEAVDFITDSSSSNRYIISIGPGIFIEPLINLVGKPYISIKGSDIQTTIIQPDDNSHNVFEIGEFNELSFMWIESAGSGKAGIACIDSGNYSVAHKVTFNNCDIGILVQSIDSGGDGVYFYGEYLDINGDFSYGVKVESTNGNIAYCSLENYFTFPQSNSIPSIGSAAYGIGASLEIWSGTHTGYEPVVSGSKGLLIDNGAECEVGNLTITHVDLGISSPNSANPCNILILAINLHENTQDVNIENINTSGSFTGISSHPKVSKAIGNTSFAWSFLDIDDHEFEICDELAVTQVLGTHTELLNIIQNRGVGLTSGGIITVGTGKAVNVSAPTGYLINSLGELAYYTPNAVTNLSVPNSNEQYYIYVNQSGSIVSHTVRPAANTTILLGRVGTNSTGIQFIDAVQSPVTNTTSNIGDMNKSIFGPLYSYGSIVSVGSSALKIDISNGKYYVGVNFFTPSGGSDISFDKYYQNGSGGWTIINSANTIPTDKYDDGSGTLASIPGGKYVKHLIYVIGQGVNEKYFFVYGQELFDDTNAATNGNLPTPPSYFDDGIVRVASFVVLSGASSIAEILSERPLAITQTSATAAVSNHNALTGLIDGNAGHSQFYMLNGSTPLAADMDADGNSLTNVNLINGVDIEAHASRHLPNSGTDALTVAAPLTSLSTSTTNASGSANSLSRSDHTHRIVTASANTVSTIVARDSSGNFSAGTITANLTGNADTVTTNANLTGDITSIGNATAIASGVIVNADINASAGIVDTKLATISTSGKVSNSATTATNANTASAIVARDSSGDFSAGTITATLSGTATNFSGSLSGDVTGTQGATAISATTVTGKALTGFVSGAGTITSSDTILTAIDKLDGNIAGKQDSGNYIIALTSDVTASGPGSATATIANNTVTNAKAAQMATNTIKGNNTGSTANAIDLTTTQTTAMLNIMVGDSGAGGTKGLVPAPATGDAAANKYLKASGAWVANAVSTSTPADPTTTTSTVGVMMGLAGSITPTGNGKVLITITGDVDNATNSRGVLIQLRTGTGTAPVNGAALTGTTRGNPVNFAQNNAAIRAPFTVQSVITGLTLSTAIWIDVSIASVGAGTARIRDITISAIEI